MAETPPNEGIPAPDSGPELDNMPHPGPNPPPAPPEAHHDLAVRMLYDEQTRLRAELEALRQGKEQEEQQKKQGGEDKGEGGEKKEGGGDDKKDGDKKDDKGGGDDKKDGDKKDDKEKKPPLKDRVGKWVKDHPIGTTAIAIATVLLIIGIIWLFIYLGSYEETDDAFVEGHTDPISARINGFVTGVYVENTYHVKKGQLLVQLDERDYRVAKEQSAAQLSQAQANIAAQQPNVGITATNQSTDVINAQQNLNSSEANVLATEERYRSAIADLQQAEANRDNAEREEERYRALVVKEEVSREQYDQQATNARAQAAVVSARQQTADATAKQVTQAEASLKQAQAQLKSAKANLPRQVAAQRATLAEREASAKQALAQASQSELNLEYTRIYAPEDGVIGDKSVELNTQVTPGQEMFALTQTNDIWVEANFKETEITNMHPGQSVTVYVDALKKGFDGYVEALPGGSGAIYSLLPPENATGNYVKVVQRLPVRIRIKPGQLGADRLTPGMSVEPKVWIK